jgi:hypothetical protein
VCYTLSLWENDDSILEFNKLPIHVNTANWAIRHLFFSNLRGAELWSTHWKLHGVSNNLKWGDLDLKGIVAQRGASGPEEEAGPAVAVEEQVR